MTEVAAVILACLDRWDTLGMVLIGNGITLFVFFVMGSTR